MRSKHVHCFLQVELLENKGDLVSISDCTYHVVQLLLSFVSGNTGRNFALTKSLCIQAQRSMMSTHQQRMWRQLARAFCVQALCSTSKFNHSVLRTPLVCSGAPFSFAYSHLNHHDKQDNGMPKSTLQNDFGSDVIPFAVHNGLAVQALQVGYYIIFHVVVSFIRPACTTFTVCAATRPC